jgi:type IV secretion system protein TrbL
MNGFVDPFAGLASAAGKVVADGWTAAMLGIWNAGLWLLRLAETFLDSLLTPDLSETGPGAWLYRVMFWIAGALLLIMALVQLGTAVIKRDGKGLARVAIGLGQFMVVWGGWIGYGITIVAACSGLTRALMEGLLKVTSWSAWQPWTPFTPADISDGTVATVLGLMGLLLWIAAIGHFLVMLARTAALMVLMATTPIAAAGLVSEAGKAWFWKSLRWFHAAALSPVLMVLVLGIGVQFTTGVANGLTGVQGAIGTAVPGVILICVATVSPLALFKLLAFVDPATTSGASLRAGLSAMGSVQGLLGGTGAGSNQAAATDGNGRSAGEDGADDATSSRFTSTLQGGMSRLGPAGQVVGQGMGLMVGIGGTAAAVGADLSNQMGVGHPTYPPDFSRAGQRASYGPSGDQADPGHGSDGNVGSEADTYPGVDPGGYPDTGVSSSPAADTSIEGTGSSPITGGSMLAGPGGSPAGAVGGGSGAGAAAGEAGAADAAIVLI